MKQPSLPFCGVQLCDTQLCDTQLYDVQLCDAHTHLDGPEDLRRRCESGILSLICASTPGDAAILQKTAAIPEYSSLIVPTFGLHPWRAESGSLDEMMPYLLSCPVIGEIGMDSVWCDVPLSTQEIIFRKQLVIACDRKKPVILHTKGQERTIASIISEYPNTYLVHWYSCGEYLTDYMDLGCYFTIGPDVVQNPAVQMTAAIVPLNRILMETDGMGAVRWAYEGQNDCPEHPAAALSASLQSVAAIRRIGVNRLAEQVFENLSVFLHEGGF